jgi:vancomycin permeability regulator SanA
MAMTSRRRKKAPPVRVTREAAIIMPFRDAMVPLDLPKAQAWIKSPGGTTQNCRLDPLCFADSVGTARIGMTRKKIIKYALILTGITAIVFSACAGLLAWSGMQDDLHHADVALVLGNTVDPDGSPSPRLRARLERTLELYRLGYFPTVIVSGGIGKEGYDEAAVMKKYLSARGIPESAIIADNQGTTTFASAQNTLRILREQKLGSVLVVSQYFHIPRARIALGKSGVSPVYSAHAYYFEARDIYSTAREVIGCIEYECRRYDAPREKNDN